MIFSPTYLVSLYTSKYPCIDPKKKTTPSKDKEMRRAICILTGSGLSGTVSFQQRDERSPVRVVIDIRGFGGEGVHAIHIHEYGDTREGCKSLGGHWNPTKQPHGRRQLGTVRHAGDLVNNIFPNPRGVVIKEFDDTSITLCGDHSILGRSVVIHGFPDDLGTQGEPLHYDNNPRGRSLEVVLYRDMSDNDLRRILRTRKLTEDPLIVNGTRAGMIRFLEKNSLSTGNAGGRMACGIIGACS